MRVDLPEPEGPVMKRIWLGAREMWRLSAMGKRWRVSSPRPKWVAMSKAEGEGRTEVLMQALRYMG